MHIPSLAAGSIASFTLIALVACSSSTKDTTPTTTDAATGADASPDTSVVEAGPDPKTACMKLTAMNTTTQTKITFGAANKHPLAGAPTTGMGGTIVDGTYRITGYDEYLDVPTATTTILGTVQVQGGLYEIVLPDGESGGGSYEIT